MHVNPYLAVIESSGMWFRANFHLHAGAEDACGIYPLDEVVRVYKEAGYQVLTVSNHDCYTDVAHLSSEYGIRLINGFEYSRNTHMLCIGCKGLIAGDHQALIDECTSQEGHVVLCHPNWQRQGYWSEEALAELSGYTGIEVLNGVIIRHKGTGLAEDTWDHLLSRGKLVWGFGNDDFHRWYDIAKSWTMIYARSDQQEDVQEAIRDGAFYVSSGLVLEEIGFADGVLSLRAAEPGCYPRNYEYSFVGEHGRLLAKQRAREGRYEIDPAEPYVRVKVMGDQGYLLLTQPIYHPDRLHRP